MTISNRDDGRGRTLNNRATFPGGWHRRDQREGVIIERGVSRAGEVERDRRCAGCFDSDGRAVALAGIFVRRDVAGDPDLIPTRYQFCNEFREDGQRRNDPIVTDAMKDDCFDATTLERFVDLSHHRVGGAEVDHGTTTTEIRAWDEVLGRE